MNLEKFYLKYCEYVGGYLKAEPSKDLKSSVKFLRWKIKPERIVGAARFTLLASFVLLVILIGVTIYLEINFLPIIFLLFLPIILFYTITEWPKIHSNDVAVKALGYSPQLISQIAVPLTMRPNLENSISIAAKHGEGEIAKDLKNIMWDIWTGKKKNIHDALRELADKWSKYSKGFQRSIYLILGSFHESDERKKKENLDKAVKTMLDDVLTKMTDYANSLHTPTLILFSLGIIVPLMTISIFPIISFFGMEVGHNAVTSFLFISLLASLLYSSYILKKRPVTFSQKEVRQDVPDGYINFGTLLPAKITGLIVAILISAPSIFYIFSEMGVILSGPIKMIADLFGTLPMIWGIGLGFSIYFFSKSAYKITKRKNMKNLEEEFSDSLYHLRNRLSDRSPIETSIEYVTKIMKGSEIGKFYTRILNKIRRRNITLEKAVKEEDLDSDMINSSLGLITNSLKDGSEAAAKTTETIHDYTTNMRKVDKSLNSMLNKNLSMMKTTAMFFAPIVCAVIVVLFQMITNTVIEASTNMGDDAFGFSQIGAGTFVQPQITPQYLQLIVGIYLLGLNYVLVRYVSRIQYGFDNVSMYYDLARFIPITLLIFTATSILAQQLLLRGLLGL